MTSAKLFNIAAAGFGLLAFMLKAFRYNQALDLYVYDGVFVVSIFGVALGACLICGIFALLYFACAHWLRIPLNLGLSLANFFFVVVPLVEITWAVHALRPVLLQAVNSRQTIFFMVHFATAATCFLLGCLLFVANFGWSLIRGLRPQK